MILDILIRRAKTAQAKAQVELAQYQYIITPSPWWRKHLERLAVLVQEVPVEVKYETDRRIVRDKITLLRKRLAEIDKQAFTQRKDRGEFIRVALVGYTNVGKSTIMNSFIKEMYLQKIKHLLRLIPPPAKWFLILLLVIMLSIHP